MILLSININNIGNKVQIRLITKIDFKNCNDFYNRIYGKRRTYKQWEWEFINNNYKPDEIPFVVVDDNGRIAGTQAFIPVRMIDQNGIYWTAKSEETLVDPDYRGNQLFEKMYKLLFDYAKDHKFKSIWGFTPATKAFKRLDFAIPGKTTQIFFPFSVRSVPSLIGKLDPKGDKATLMKIKSAVYKMGCGLARIRSNLKFGLNKKMSLNDIEIRTLDSAPKESGQLCEEFIKKWGGNTIYRDEEYLNWRIFNNPYIKANFRVVYYNNKLIGWIAFGLGDDGMGYLIDVIIGNTDNIKYTQNDIVKILLTDALIKVRNMGATGFRGWRVNNHPFDKMICQVAGKLGFYHFKKGSTVVLHTLNIRDNDFTQKLFDEMYISRIFTEGVFG